MRLSQIVLAASVTLAFAVHAQPYPTKPIRLVVGFAPGGNTDVVARVVGQKLGERLGQQVVIENKAGAGGTIATAEVARAAPDGYTLTMGTTTTHAIAVAAYQNLQYDPSADFEPLALVAVAPYLLVVQSKLPVRDLQEFVAYVKSQPGKLNYGSAGLGTVSFFTMELIKISYGLDIAHVPFQGTGPVKNAILGGHVSLASSGLGSMAPLIKSGEVIPLVTTAPKRPAGFANVPTMAEKGFPEATLNIWMGLYVPLKTPKEAVEKLSRALEKTVKDPTVIGATEKAGMVIDHRGSEATRKLLESEHDAIKKAVAKLGLGKK